MTAALEDLRDGQRKIDWAAAWMPVLGGVRDRLIADGSVRGRRVGIILPIEAKTAYLAVVLAEAGAEVSLAAPGALTQPDVAMAVAERGVSVFADPDSTPTEEAAFYDAVLDRRPEVVIDDRAELIRLAHTTRTDVLPGLLGGSEETTSGVTLLRAMERDGQLRFPCIAANDARCKHLFDNRYGTGQSAVLALLDTTNLLLAGQTMVIVGYGWVGKGAARRARGMGAQVVVCEVDPVAALEAYHDGFDVAPLVEACAGAAWLLGCSGCPGAIGVPALAALPDGAVVANAAGIDDEIDMDGLRRSAAEIRSVRAHVDEYVMEDRSLFIVGDGKVVNLSAGDGHPIEIMDLTFGIQALAAHHLLTRAGDLPPGLHPVPGAIDDAVARAKLDALGMHVDELTEVQRTYLWG